MMAVKHITKYRNFKRCTELPVLLIKTSLNEHKKANSQNMTKSH